jgi:hypothetical protein
MKTRIYIEFPGEMTLDNIKYMESYLSDEFHNRAILDDYRAYIDLNKNENPDLDEVSNFIIELDGSEFATFWGFPLDDDSNITTNLDFKNYRIADVE